jgi:hypothetical protein
MVGINWLLALICAAWCNATVASGPDEGPPVERPLAAQQDDCVLMFPEETVNGLTLKKRLSSRSIASRIQI